MDASFNTLWGQVIDETRFSRNDGELYSSAEFVETFAFQLLLYQCTALRRGVEYFDFGGENTWQTLGKQRQAKASISSLLHTNPARAGP